jgi:pimeloyl-ACP methyl ester carboxylesterase
MAPSGCKPPVIFIPGILGSRLVNTRTGKTVWPDLQGGATELALPISAPTLAENRDDIVATEVLEEAHFSYFVPSVAVYGPLLAALERNGGYRRGDFNAPPPTGYADTLYVFPYDWRRDIVESARDLGAKIEELKQRLGRPDLRFDIVTHSMGGLVARYYAMYGERDVLDCPNALPDWAGARNLGKIIMISSPNDGSMNAFRTLLRGFAVVDSGKPTRGVISKFARKYLVARVGPGEVFTSPALYELLPPPQNTRFFDGTMKPLPVDLYNVETWRYYEWSAAFDERARWRELNRLIDDLGTMDGNAESLRLAAERECFLRLVLRRACAFHNAIEAECPPPPTLRFIFIGGDCIPTLNGAIILTAAPPRTIFRPSEFPAENGSRRKVRELLFTPGDGAVTSHSLLGYPLNPQMADPIPTALRSTPVEATYFCRSHLGLITDKGVQNYLLVTLLVQ